MVGLGKIVIYLVTLDELSFSFLSNIKLKSFQSFEMTRPHLISVFLWLTHVDALMYNLNLLSLHF